MRTFQQSAEESTHPPPPEWGLDKKKRESTGRSATLLVDRAVDKSKLSYSEPHRGISIT